jgi:hypothetical protein
MLRTALALALTATAALAQAPRNPARTQSAAHPAPAAAKAPAPKQAAELDLTPTIAEINEDGLMMKKLIWKQPQGRVQIMIPPGWVVEGGPGVTIFRLKDDSRATIHFLASPVPNLPLDTDAKVEAVRNAIVATAPNGAEKIEFMSEAKNPLLINGWGSHQVTFAYTVFGVRYVKTAMFVKISDRQELQVIAVAPEASFPRASQGINIALNSWYNEPGPAVAATPVAN